MDRVRIAHIMFHMNKPEVVKAMARIYTEKDLKQIQEYMRETHSDACVECEAYYNLFDGEGYCIGYRCALDDNIKIEDREKIHENCPLLSGINIWKKEAQRC